jgi:transposase
LGVAMIQGWFRGAALGAIERLVLNDARWARISGLILGRPEAPGSTGRDNRMFVEGVLWIVRTGAPWRDLPEVFGRWNSAFRRFSRWAAKGVWDRLFAALSDDADFRIPDPRQHHRACAPARRRPHRIFGPGGRRLSAGEGTKGPRLHDWAYLELAHLEADEYIAGFTGLWTRGLLVQRHVADGELAYFSTWCPKGTAIDTLLGVEGHRWAIEDAFEAAKNELGLDHNETRSWHGWHRQVPATPFSGRPRQTSMTCGSTPMRSMCVAKGRCFGPHAAPTSSGRHTTAVSRPATCPAP